MPRVGKDSIQHGQIVNDSDLQAVLMERAECLHAYLQRKIPADLRRVIAPEDILQDVWVAVFRGISSFKPDTPDAFDRWLMRITERKLLDAFRHTRRLKRGGGHQFEHEPQHRSTSYLGLFASVAANQSTPSSDEAVREAVYATQIALCTLPDDYQRAITMHYIEERPHAEVAKAMQKTRPSINSLLYRGLRMLRQRLEPAGQFFSNDG